MKIVTVVGARPQFIKASPVCKALRATGHQEFLVHTGQHYDYGMSEIFFQELGIPSPDINLDIGSGSHGVQTGQMLIKLEEVLLAEKPDWVLVYGDTNSTLAGALAASKLHVPIAHVEAGLRSFNRDMPEEINRVMTDHLSTLLLCPTQTAVNNLAAEGLRCGVHLVGDVMADALEDAVERARRRSSVLERLGLNERGYLLATIHRAENTDNASRLKNILAAFNEIDELVIFPIHPRTRKKITELRDASDMPGMKGNLRLIEPVGYLDMVMLERSARLILTDSGGIQKEAYWLGVPCVTLRDETEWVETVSSGWNKIVGSDPERVVSAVYAKDWPDTRPACYGNSNAAPRVAASLSCNSLVGPARSDTLASEPAQSRIKSRVELNGKISRP